MFVVFEGSDGSGKTTLSNQVALRLEQRGISVKHLRADGKFSSAISEALRALTRDCKNLALLPKAEFLLYVAREVQLIGEVLRPALRSHQVVLADRFLYTAQVLGKFGRNLEEAWVAPILKAASDGIEPDLVLLVDVDPFLGRARRKAAKIKSPSASARPPSRKSLAGVGFQRRVREGYLELAETNPERWVKIDNGGELEDAVIRTCALIEGALERGAPAASAEYRSATPPAAAAFAGSAPNSPEDALERFSAWVAERAEREPAVGAHVLGGLFGPGIDALRLRIAERAPGPMLAGLAGLADEVSWQLRDSLAREHPAAAALSLSGLPNDDTRARRLRLELYPLASAEITASLSGLDDEAAWELRERAYERHPDAVVASLARLASARAWELRERWLSSRTARLKDDYQLSDTAARAITGLDDERAWTVRRAAREAAPVSALKSLSGVTDAESWQWRAAVLPQAPRPVMQTLRDLRTWQAWDLRALVARQCKEALDSIVGLDEPEAWSLRNAYADVWPSTVLKSLGGLAAKERALKLVEQLLALHGRDLGVLRHASAFALERQRQPRHEGEALAGKPSEIPDVTAIRRVAFATD